MRLLITATAALMMTAPVFAGSHETGYMAAELMQTCQDADNDARGGAAAETECEQYLLGFVEALAVTGMAGSGTEICPPEVNVADEIRWAYIRWIYGDFSARKALPAADAVLGTLKDSFACSG
ncbi:MAG: Rap1a/Tai family immunity protein [Rhodobacter sp.]|nr:Rap1a/Tai family immunity protein [Rhodobacter sp.]